MFGTASRCCEPLFVTIFFFFPAYPDVQVRQLNDDWEFIVIACDGIWEVLSNEVSIDFYLFLLDYAT